MTCRFNECEGGRMGTHCRAECVPRQSETLRLAAVPIFNRSITWQSQATIELRRLHAERTAADGVINDLAAKVRGLQTQRDALLEALHAIVRRVNGAASYRMGSDIDALARAAIKAVEGEKE